MSRVFYRAAPSRIENGEVVVDVRMTKLGTMWLTLRALARIRIELAY